MATMKESGWRATVTEIVRALVADEGFDANRALTGNGCTALMLAVDHNHPSCVRALAAVRGIDINIRCAQYFCKTALHDACFEQSAEMVEVLLVAGGCRFVRDELGNTPLDDAKGHTGVATVFASGVDYWQRTRHRGHSCSMKEAVTTVLLVRTRLGSGLGPHLPEEMWLAACGFLRSADFHDAKA